MNNVEVKIVNKSNNPNPSYATPQSAGMDIRAFLPEESVMLYPRQAKIINTGIYVEIPEGYEIQIRSRSGLAWHNSVIVLNAPGTIDADYRGEIGVILYNMGDESFLIKNGDRIAQMVLSQFNQADFISVDKLSETKRADGGFGHTGLK
jgi:dUTP pyrophosphatase